MTQMMLFDPNTLVNSPLPMASTATGHLSPVATTVAPLPESRAGRPTAPPRETRPTTTLESPAIESSRSKLTEETDGVQRMGDLARLVILRYQLVARRREEMAARAGSQA